LKLLPELVIQSSSTKEVEVEMRHKLTTLSAAVNCQAITVRRDAFLLS